MEKPKQQNAANSNGFTLIEVLTVIAIITVLAGLLFPAISGSIQKGKSAVARADVKAIETAVKQYQTEYGKLPLINGDQGTANDKYFNTSASNEQYFLIDWLKGTAPAARVWALDEVNPRRVQFLDIPGRKNALSTEGYFQDPWGTVYTIVIDKDYNRDIEGIPIPLSVIARSAGPDKTLGTPDDIESYK